MKIDIKGLTEGLDQYEIKNSKVFKVYTTQKTSTIANTDFTFDDDEVFPEGKEKTFWHKDKERNSNAPKRKKKWVLEKTGKLECEVCGFDFVKKYGKLGYGFAECHHLTPVASLTENHETTISDLAIVCSNCHRMLHRSRPLISVKELKDLIKG